MSDRNTKKIVVLGGGFGGAYTVRSLERLTSSEKVQITLVSRNNYFLMTPLLFEAGSGVLEPRHAVTPLRMMVKEAHFVEAEVSGIDFENRIVHASPVEEVELKIPYDHLVIALGGVTNTSLVPGGENAMTFKTLGDAIFVRNQMIDLFERANVETDTAKRKQMLSYAIVGAGLVGVELVGELTEFTANVLGSYKNIDPKELRFELIEAGKRIMPEMDPELSEYATLVLSHRGVNVRVNTKVSRIEPGKVVLENEAIDCSTIVIATGVKPSPLIEKLDLEKDRKGRIVTGPDMRTKSRENVWALGDCASIPDPASKDGRPYPQLAQHALREARLLAKNIVAKMEGQPTKPFIYSNKGMLAALGHFQGVGRVYKFRIYGFIAWWVWRSYYLLQMPKISRRIRIIIDWTVALMFKNDIVKLDLFGDEHPLTRPAGGPEKKEVTETIS